MFIRIIIGICLVLMTGQWANASNEKKIALVMKDLFNPFFQKMESGAKAYAAKKNLDLEVFGIERETDVDRQISIVKRLISGKYGAIVIAPADSKKLIPVCKQAIGQKIAVINIDNPFHKETLEQNKIKIPFVGSDNHKGAAMAGEYIRKKIGNSGEVVILEGIRGVENAELHKKGFTDSITAGSQIKITASETANWHKDEAFSVMTRILQKTKDIKAVLCANDMMAIGAVQALEMAGLAGKVWVGSYDNIEEVRLEMRNKRIHATIEQHPELMGEYGVRLAADALAGKPVADYTSTPLDLISYENFDKTIGFSVSTLANPFFDLLSKSAKKEADIYGIRLVVADAGNDDAKQMLDIQKFVQDKVNLIIVNPTNVETVLPALELAKAAGIKVISVDRKVSEEDLVISHTASDNLLGGKLAAEFIAKKLKGKGKILELEGIPGTSAAHDRGKGFNDAIGKFPDIKVAAREMAGFDRAKAKNTVKQLIAKNAEFDAVFAHNDEMILGAYDAYSEGGKRPSVLVGFDAIPDAIAAIGEKKLTATVAQKPELMGELAIESAAMFFRGETVPKTRLADLELVVGQ